MRNIYLILPIVLFSLLVSGCTIPFMPTGNPFNSNTPSGTGVVIESFGPDFSEVYSGEPVTFSMKVKNTGSVKAESGFAEMLGIDQRWSPVNVSNFNKESQELFPEEERCRYTTMGTDKGITLLPGDNIAGTTGGEDVCTWKYVAPSIETGLKIIATPRVRFFYEYTSSTIKTITIVPRDELKTLQDQGKALPSESYSKTSSPVSIEIDTASPIRAYGDKVEYPIVITVQNIGGGTVCSSLNECKKTPTDESNIKSGWYKVNINILVPEGDTLSCEQVESVLLIGSTPQSLSCKVTSKIKSDQIGLIQKKIEVKSKYGYFIDKSSQVIVLPSNQP